MLRRRSINTQKSRKPTLGIEEGLRASRNQMDDIANCVIGCLIECDPSIRALILNIDSRTHDIIIEELDDTHLLIDSNKLDYLKKKLGDTLDENTFNPNEVEEK